MKTRNKHHELAFLRYLDALEGGDAVAIMNFLEQAEQDEILRQMMLDYHEQDNEIEEKLPMKINIPFKLKREQTRRMIQIVGTSAIAALMLITVGVTGVFVGLGQQNETAITDAQNCSVSLANEDNTVNLIGGDDIKSAIRVGVNNPFTLYLNTGQASEGYQVTFEGLRAIMAYDDLVIEGDCSQERVLTIYPTGELGQSCEIEMELIQFLGSPNTYYEAFIYDSEVDPRFMGAAGENPPYLGTGNRVVVFDSPVEGFYPLIANDLRGGIPAEAIHLTGSCVNYPLLYLPPRSEESHEHDNPDEAQSHSALQLDGIRVREQQFENATMFYLEALDIVWVAYVDKTGMNDVNRWLVFGDIPPPLPSEFSVMYGFENSFTQEGETFFYPEEGIFRDIQIVYNIVEMEVDGSDISITNMFGWGISEATTYMAAYEYRKTGPYPNRFHENDGYMLSHIVQSSTGEYYQFYANWQSWRILDED